MASTRYSHQPLQIYQDPVSSFDPDQEAAAAPMQKSSKLESSSPLRPIKNAASRRNIVFNPPKIGPNKKSPLKSTQQLSSSPSLSSKLNVIPMPPPGRDSCNTDSMEKRQPAMSRFKTGPHKVLFTTFPKHADKENYPQSSAHPSAVLGYSDGSTTNTFALDGYYEQKPKPKRVLMDAAPIDESRTTKKSSADTDVPVDEIPPPDSFPPLHDDGTKPAHSYAQLIGMAILRAPNRRLTLAQIYKWISDTYSYYNAGDAGWQNSIRHNLSLNKAFIKQERPKDDPGKGNYWAIQPGSEAQFFKEKPGRKPNGPNENVPILAARASSTLGQEKFQPMYKTLTPAPQELPRPQPIHKAPEPHFTDAELSSDATIPASDAYLPEDETEERDAVPLSNHLLRSSPPPAVIHSSPPVVRQITRRDDTPPPPPRFPTSSINRSHKRKFASMDDKADRPRIKRGRAEEEIARLRGSSYDSPSKGRSFMAQSSLYAPPSSSPLRRAKPAEHGQMLPPLTPAVKLKPPTRPPQSVSPNTNLRMHRARVRELVGSPAHELPGLDENLPWSPAFNLDESTFVFQEFGSDFDVFSDNGTGLLSIPGNGSPEKRSAKKARLERSKSANVLTDISNSSFMKSITSTPRLTFTPSLDASLFDSPTRATGMMRSPSKILGLDSPIKIGSPAFGNAAFDLPQEDFYGAEFLTEEINDFSGVDIMQGFQKIGAGGNIRNTPKGNPRASLGRSFSTRF
ncbi:hypothetical protein F5884DRAFT_659550 [Xylogone sp. PMI_703]|nr:hypothetical protein F5884DRAFT_659550 [Xylogone sp. PMI_703]